MIFNPSLWVCSPLVRFFSRWISDCIFVCLHISIVVSHPAYEQDGHLKHGAANMQGHHWVFLFWWLGMLFDWVATSVSNGFSHFRRQSISFLVNLCKHILILVYCISLLTGSQIVSRKDKNNLFVWMSAQNILAISCFPVWASLMEIADVSESFGPLLNEIKHFCKTQ